jgi:hypothetical protein
MGLCTIHQVFGSNALEADIPKVKQAVSVYAAAERRNKTNKQTQKQTNKIRTRTGKAPASKQNRPHLCGRTFQFEYVSGILQKTISLVNSDNSGISSANAPRAGSAGRSGGTRPQPCVRQKRRWS